MPPVTVTVELPLHIMKQLLSICVVVVFSAGGSLRLTVVVAIQLFASVIVNV